MTTVHTSGLNVKYTFGQGGQESTTLETALLDSNNGVLSNDVISIATAGINSQVSTVFYRQPIYVL